MSKVAHKRIARGTRIQVEHAQAWNDIETELQNGNITRDQLETAWAPTTLRWNIPWIDGRYVMANMARLSIGSDCVVFLIPFLVPLPQEAFDRTGYISVSQEPVVLDQVKFSHDTRGEACALSDQCWGQLGGAGPYGGNIAQHGRRCTDLIERLDVTLSLYEHTPTFFGGYAAHMDEDAYRLRDQVYTTTIAAGAAYSSEGLRLNPICLKDLNITLDRYKTYVWAIQCPGLYDAADANKSLALVNIVLESVLLSPVIERDVNAGTQVNPTIQNMPTVHDGMPTTPYIGSYGPLAGAPIRAYGRRGVQREIGNLDRHLRRHLYGGYDRWGCNHGDQNSVHHDACYSVLAIPMWQNQQEGEACASTIDYVGEAWNAGGGAYDRPIIDKRKVELGRPFVIHHVFALVNWQSRKDTADYDTGLYQGSFITHDVVVGIGTRGDHVALQDVAYLQWALDDTGAGTPHMTHLVDRIGWPYPIGVAGRVATIGRHDAFAYEVMSIPLVNDRIHYGSGYGPPTSNGYPFWVGKSRSASRSRSYVGGGALGWVAPQTIGAEQYLECRWSVTPNPDFANLYGGIGVRPELVWGTGFQGGWILLVGKQHMAIRGR